MVAVARATMEDIAALAELFDAYRVFYEQESDLARARSFLQARLERGDGILFVARDDHGNAVGFTLLYPCFSSVSTQRIWILNDLFVAPAARRSGAGRALLRRAREFARETGALRVELATAHANLTAQALYESEGYQLDSVFRRYSLRIED